MRRYAETCTFSRRKKVERGSEAAAFGDVKRIILKKKVEELSHTNKHADATLIELNRKVSGN